MPNKAILDEQKKTIFDYQPLISVVTPTFNTPKQFLIEMIESILAQTYANWELCIADGASNNWKFLEPNTTHHILDFYHATEYLTDVSHAFCPDSEGKRKKWLDDACHALKHVKGAAADLLNQMRSKQEEITEKKKINKAIKNNLNKTITYFENQQHRMDYSTYQAQNMPIGSGVTEAACKTLIKERLCKSGMKWKDVGAKTVLALRSLVRTTNRWEQFWQKMTQNGWDDLNLA